jgi:hypothetical protein
MKTFRKSIILMVFCTISLMFVIPATAATRNRTSPPPPVSTDIKPPVSPV